MPETSGPALQEAWNTLQDHFKETHIFYSEVERKRQKRDLTLDVIGMCCCQLEMAMAVGWREGGPAKGIAIMIMRSCIGELIKAAEMVKGM